MAFANLRDDGCAYFRQRLHVPFPLDPTTVAAQVTDDKTIFEYREQLQKLWLRETDSGFVLSHWVGLASPLSTWIVSAWGDGTHSVEPNYENFPLALAIAAGEWIPKMAVCANPKCPAPYFLKARRTQRFCDRPGCIEYGQRQHKLEWWRRVGAKRRADRTKTLSKPNRSEGRKRR